MKLIESSAMNPKLENKPEFDFGIAIKSKFSHNEDIDCWYKSECTFLQ